MNHVTITIGYDDHVSTYSIPRDCITSVLTMQCVDEISTHIIEHGERVDEDGEVFFDHSNSDIDELHVQLKQVLSDS